MTTTAQITETSSTTTAIEEINGFSTILIVTAFSSLNDDGVRLTGAAYEFDGSPLYQAGITNGSLKGLDRDVERVLAHLRQQVSEIIL